MQPDLPSRRDGQSEVLILGNGPSLLGRPWANVPRERVFVFGVNQSWRVVHDADAHFSNDDDQFQFNNPTAAGFGGAAYYQALAERGGLFHTGGATIGRRLHRHDALIFSRHPFRKRHHGAHTKPPALREDGGVALKIGPGYSGSSAYVVLQMVAAAGFERVWFVGLDMGKLKFDGAHGWTAFGKRTPTTVGAWSNSDKHDAVWAKVPADVKERCRVIAPSLTQQFEVVEWPWGKA